MGIYNRDYFRDGKNNWSGASWGFYSLTPVVKYLIIANVVIYLLQIFVVRDDRASILEQMRKQNPRFDEYLAQKEKDGPEAIDAVKKQHPEWFDDTETDLDAALHRGAKVSIVQEWLELDTNKVVRKGQVWRLLTHAFCHDRYGLFHIVINMLLLYWFGGTLETMYGQREFLLFYLTAALVAGLTFVGLDLYTGSRVPGIGASGAVMAVLMLYTMHFPCEEICFCWLIPVQMRWLMLFYLIYDLHPILLALTGDQFFTGIAHAAHLGGLAFGFFYAKFQWRLESLVDWIPRLRNAQSERPRLRVATSTCPRPNRDADQLDDLLRKISETGQDSLTDDERAVLRNASERLKNRAKH